VRAMKPEKLLKTRLSEALKDSAQQFANEYAKVTLKRDQYLHNLMATNRTCLMNNNINTLLLF
jgi:hypothetical protein